MSFDVCAYGLVQIRLCHMCAAFIVDVPALHQHMLDHVLRDDESNEEDFLSDPSHHSCEPWPTKSSPVPDSRIEVT